MSEPFEGCWQRIERAETHSKTLAQLWNEFLEDDPYSAVANVDENGAGTILVVPSYDSLPKVFALQLGELLYQLRAALDGSVYACAILETDQNPPPNEDRLEFPICKSEARFNKSVWKIEPLSEERRKIIASVQPYYASDWQKLGADSARNVPDALSILNDWARKDRHRKLHVVSSWASNAKPQLRIPPGTKLAEMFVRNDGFLERDNEIATFVIAGWKPGMKVQANPDLMIDICVDEITPPSSPNDTLGNRIATMIFAVRFVVDSLGKSFRR